MGLARGVAVSRAETRLRFEKHQAGPAEPQVLPTTFVVFMVAAIYSLVMANRSQWFFVWYGLAIGAALIIPFLSAKWEGGWLFAALFFGAVCFQNLFLGASLGLTNAFKKDPILFMVEIKTVLLFAGWGVFLLDVLRRRISLKRERTEFGGIPGMAFALLIAGSFLLSPGSLFARTAYVRNFLSPVAGWYLGRLAVQKKHNFDRIVGIMLSVGVLLSIVSLVELINPRVWIDYLQLDLLIAYKGPTAEYTDFLGYVVRRLFTGVGTPINASFIFSLLFLLALFMRRYWLAGLFGLQAFLTFAKAGMLVAFVGTLLFIFRHQVEKGRSWKRAALISVPAFLLLTAAYFRFVGATTGQMTATDWQGIYSNTVVGHVEGLVGGLRSVLRAPFGEGLGTSGNMNEVGANIDYSTADYGDRYIGGAESSVGVILFQLGLVGLILLFAWYFRRMQELFLAFRQFMHTYPVYAGLALAGLGACLGDILAQLFSEAALVPQAAGIVFMFGGMVCSLAIQMAKETQVVARRGVETSYSLLPPRFGFRLAKGSPVRH
jgi:hypothetical protein